MSSPYQPSVLLDAGPAIYIAKVEAFHLLYSVFGPAGITPAVERETLVQGLKRGLPDARLMAEALDKALILRVVPTQAEQQLAQDLARSAPNLGAGELEVIACAGSRALPAILADRNARRLAAKQNIRTWQVADLLFIGLIRENLDLRAFKTYLRKLASLTGMDAATLAEREMLAEEIASSQRKE